MILPLITSTTSLSTLGVSALGVKFSSANESILTTCLRFYMRLTVCIKQQKKKSGFSCWYCWRFVCKIATCDDYMFATSNMIVFCSEIRTAMSFAGYNWSFTERKWRGMLLDLTLESSCISSTISFRCSPLRHVYGTNIKNKVRSSWS